MCKYLSKISEFCSLHFQLQIIYLRQSEVNSCQGTLGDNQTRCDTRSDVWGFKFILFICMQLVCFCGEVGYLQIMLIQL